uniref:Uncharacterized protein n=1 Tax=Avena sativa TaxID=4498 RepID=A0ACD5ZKX4_AVESA
MAVSGGMIALLIIVVITSGVVIVACFVMVYLCTRPRSGNNRGNDETRGAIASDEMEVAMMGSMSFFIAGVQNERPIRFSSQQLRGFTQGFAHRVGSGGFGVVYRGCFPDGTPVAVKVLNSTLGRRAEEQFMAEVGTIGRTCHINLVRLYGFCFDATVKALVYEYMENGSLDQHLFGLGGQQRGPAVGFEKLHEIAVGTAKAVRYLHEECQHRIIHRDIKPENVLLGAGLAPKVSDFGLAKLCDREDGGCPLTTLTGARGTPGYAAPELWVPLPATDKCDVYSYGMLLFEMLGRRRNLELGLLHSRESLEWYPRWAWQRFEAGEMDAVLARARAAGSADDAEKAARMCKLALWCVQYRPEDRPSMGSVVRMLEGEDQIATPGNPFAHLAPYSSDGFSGVTLSTTTTTTESDRSYIN